MAAERNPEIRKAVDTLYELSGNEQVRGEYEMRLKAWRDRLSQNEGYYQDGVLKGLEKGREEVARNAIAKGLSIEVIHDITGLDIEAIRNIGK